ncbi:hypothetical protein G6K96_21520 [Agrobacterium vitis]|uniref:hypothetical protein n=1 Tax=Agrobacterium vitis TaxID=373 RepID=UPI001572A621|nr:hypothetical protein [Agrobacterium vitis]NTA34314.1 hypothetical protein [Agrobacterium vitis]
MATEFDDSDHWGLFLTNNNKADSTTLKFVRMSALTLAALRAAGLLDNMIDGTVAPATDKLWLDKNFDPPQLKEYDSVSATWQRMTFERMFNRTVVIPVAATGGTANAPVIAEPSPFMAGKVYAITPQLSNTGAVTISVTGVSSFAAVYPSGAALAANELYANSPSLFIFQNGRFELLFGYAAAAAAAASAAAAAASAASAATVLAGAVRYDIAQTKTDGEKTQARANIGAASTAQGVNADNAVQFVAQTLSDAQKTQAVTNIGLTSPPILKLIGLPFVTLDMFSGGVSASASANLTALTGAIAEKKEVKVRRGVYQMNGATFTVTDPEDIVITGEGRNTSLFSYPTAGDTGLIFNYSMASLENWWGDACTFRVENLGFRGNGAASKGLTVQQLSSTGNIRLERVLKNLSFAGRASGEYLGTGLVTTNASYLTMDGIFYRGDGTNGTAYALNGQLDSLDNSIARLYASECATGINVSGKIEGLTISDSRLVNLANGIFVSPYLAAGENVQPWVSVSNSHIAARSRGIYATDIAQLQATSNLIYLVSGSSDAIGIDLLRTEAYGIGYGLHQIIGNQVFNQQGAVGTTIGIRFESGAATGQDHSVCDGNIVANLNIGIQTYATSNQISGQNRATGCTTALNDNGSNTNLTVLTS